MREEEHTSKRAEENWESGVEEEEAGGRVGRLKFPDQSGESESIQGRNVTLLSKYRAPAAAMSFPR